MAEIILRDIEKFFGSAYVIRKLNLTIRHREFVVLAWAVRLRQDNHAARDCRP